MKAVVTGHTRGIGKALFDFLQKDYECVGYSKSTGFDIGNEEIRKQIVSDSFDADVFVNNAYRDIDHSQFELLKLFLDTYCGQNKIVINVSSRISDYGQLPTMVSQLYSNTKLRQDLFCRTYSNENKMPYLINLRPGMVDTDRALKYNNDKLTTQSVVDVVKFILDNKNNFKVSNITFGV